MFRLNEETMSTRKTLPHPSDLMGRYAMKVKKDKTSRGHITMNVSMYYINWAYSTEVMQCKKER